MDCYKVVVLLCLVAAIFAVNPPKGFDTGVCVPQDANTQDPGYKQFPAIPDQYWATLEWNDHIMKKTYKIDEFYSKLNNVGTMFVTGYMGDGITSKFITNANSNEIFIIYDTEKEEFNEGNCVVGTLETIDEWAMPFTKGKNRDILLSGRSLLDLGGTEIGAPQFVGNDYVNGIYCDLFQACLFVADGQTTVNVTYAFSYAGADNSWNMAGGVDSSIVNLHAWGKAPNEKEKSIEQSFNYAYMSPTWAENNLKYFESKFETPDHTYCPGRKNTYDIPAVPDHFSMRMEVIDNMANTVLYTHEWYDYEANYSKIYFKTPPSGNMSIDVGITPETIINDFNDGVSYLIDPFSGQCVCVPIIGGEYDSVTIGNSHTRMRDPREFFDLDQSEKWPYQYMGTHAVRSMAADSWISYRPYPNENSPDNATWEWYFSTKATIFKVRSFAEDKEPVKCSVRSPEINLDIDYNIYQFSEEEPDARVFDVSMCYEKNGSIAFEMQLKGNWAQYSAEDHMDLLDYWFRLSVESFAGVRSIRVHRPEFVFFDDHIVARFTILGPAPIQGDSKRAIKQIDLRTASDRLTEAFSTGAFLVYFMPDTNTPATTFVPIAGTLRVIERRNNPSQYRPSPTNSTENSTSYVTEMDPGIDNGAAAGLGIGMFLFGIILAVVAVVIFRFKTQSKNVPYSKQQLTLNSEENGD